MSATDAEADGDRALSPLERERLHAEQEAAGLLCFPIIWNDSTDESVMVSLSFNPALLAAPTLTHGCPWWRRRSST